MADLSYYKDLNDFELISPYLDLDPEGFEIPMKLPPFKPGTWTLILFLTRFIRLFSKFSH